MIEVTLAVDTRKQTLIFVFRHQNFIPVLKMYRILTIGRRQCHVAHFNRDLDYRFLVEELRG